MPKRYENKDFDACINKINFTGADIILPDNPGLAEPAAM